jgi:hypothetical protein
MLPPDEYEQAASEADYHVQLAIEHVQVAGSEAKLRGRVVRVFRGPASLRDSELSVPVPCATAQELAEAPPGSRPRIPVVALRRGAVLEAYLNRTRGEAVEVTAGLCGVVASASDAPYLEMGKGEEPSWQPEHRRLHLRALIGAAIAVAVAGAVWLLL